MRDTVRNIAPALVAVAATLAITAGVAWAHDDGGNSHHPNGTGSGLSGGSTQTQVVPGKHSGVPLSDPTLGEGTVLPPAYNTLGGATG